MFVIDGQLFACVNFILGISNHFFPDLGGSLMLATALGHQRQLPLRLGTNIVRQADGQRLRARAMRAT